MADGMRRRRWGSMDDDVLTSIFRLLSPRSLARCAAVCSHWHRLVTGELVSEAVKKLSDVPRRAWHHYLVEAEIFTSQAHSGRANCCHWSGERLATGSSDKTVKIWSTDSMKTLEEYRAPESVAAVKFDAYRVYAATGPDVYIWKRRASNPLRVLGGHNQRLYSMECIDDPELVVGCADGTVRIFDVYTGRCSLLLRLHTGPVTCLGSTSGSNVLVTGSQDCTVRLWDSSSGREITTFFPSTTSGVSCLQMVDNGVIFGTEFGQLNCFDFRKTARPMWSQRVSSSRVNSIHRPDYSIIGKEYIFLTGGNDGKLDLFRVHSDEKVRKWDQPRPRAVPSPVLSARLGSTRCVACHADGSVTWWNFCIDIWNKRW